MYGEKIPTKGNPSKVGYRIPKAMRDPKLRNKFIEYYENLDNKTTQNSKSEDVNRNFTSADGKKLKGILKNRNFTDPGPPYYCYNSGKFNSSDEEDSSNSNMVTPWQYKKLIKFQILKIRPKTSSY